MSRLNMMTVLSIDSGGVQGIIPGVILEYLETILQELDGTGVRLADYFDIITGTGAGGLIAAMIATPDRHGYPLFDANRIVPFFKQEFPKIFPPGTPCGIPVYRNGYLNTLARTTFGTNRVSDTMGKIAITSFDSNTLRPLIFSTDLAAADSKMNAQLSDVVIASLSAFPWLPAYNFTNQSTTFNTLNASVATANPALIAATECIREATEDKEKLERLLVISLGTCGAKNAGWTTNVLNSFTQNDITTQALPMIENFTATVNSFMVDYVLERLFENYSTSDNYLRIDDDGLTTDMNTFDLATAANMTNLENFAKNLLKKPVTKAADDPTAPRVVVEPSETYEQALQRVAISLSDLRKLRPRSTRDQASA